MTNQTDEMMSVKRTQSSQPKSPESELWGVRVITSSKKARWKCIASGKYRDRSAAVSCPNGDRDSLGDTGEFLVYSPQQRRTHQKPTFSTKSSSHHQIALKHPRGSQMTFKKPSWKTCVACRCQCIKKPQLNSSKSRFLKHSSTAFFKSRQIDGNVIPNNTPM